MHFPFPVPAGGFDPGDDYGPRAGGGVVSFNHMGVDFGRAAGTPILSPGDGVVELAQWYGGYGNAVIVNHGSGLYTLTGHQPRIEVSVGQHVKSYERIGSVGTTGNSTGPHLHLGTMTGSISHYVDPVQFMRDYAQYGESALAGLGSNPLTNQEDDDMPATVLVTANNGKKHYFTVAWQGIAHNASDGAQDIAHKVNSASDEIHYLSQPEFEVYLDAMGIPRGVVDIHEGKVLNLRANPPEGQSGATWSAELESTQKLERIIAKLGA
jgi:hypothetical protein